MSLIVLVKSEELFEETLAKSGRTVYKQQCALSTADSQFPLPFFISVDQGRPYPPGNYHIHITSFRTNNFGRLEINPYDFRLVPAKAKA